MKKYLFIVFALVFLTSCKKEEESIEVPHSSTFIVDSLVYTNNGVDFYYRIDIQGGVPPYNIKWISPDEDKGLGPYHDKLLKNTLFTAYVYDLQVDATKYQDTLTYFYDYRDKFIGNYRCIIISTNQTWDNDSLVLKDTTYTDTITIIKEGEDQLRFLERNFKLDSSWYCDYSNQPNKSQNQVLYPFYCWVNFYPKNDSLSYYYHYGDYFSHYNSQRYYGVKIE